MSRAALLRALLAPLLALLGGAPAAAQAPGFRWLDDLDQARARAALEGRPVLAVFRCVP